MNQELINQIVESVVRGKARLTKKEQDEAVTFLSKHEDCMSDIKPCAGYSYGYSIVITPANIGDCIAIKCTKCGSEQDITDEDSW